MGSGEAMAAAVTTAPPISAEATTRPTVTRILVFCMSSIPSINVPSYNDTLISGPIYAHLFPGVGAMM
jgi:hypothetical protein